MKLYFGTFSRSLDEKERTSVPPRFRRIILSFEEPTVIIHPSQDGCLVIEPRKAFEEEAAAKIRAGPVAARPKRELRRAIALDADEQDIDSQGRLHINEGLRRHAGIDKKVIFFGAVEFIEVWSPERYEEHVEALRGRLDEITDQVQEEE